MHTDALCVIRSTHVTVKAEKVTVQILKYLLIIDAYAISKFVAFSL